MVCDSRDKILCYSNDGEPLNVITLPGDIKPWSVTRREDYKTWGQYSAIQG